MINYNYFTFMITLYSYQDSKNHQKDVLKDVKKITPVQKYTLYNVKVESNLLIKPSKILIFHERRTRPKKHLLIKPKTKNEVYN